MTARERVKAFLDRREQMPSQDPESIYGHDGGHAAGGTELTVSDLRELVADDVFVAESQEFADSGTVVLGVATTLAIAQQMCDNRVKRLRDTTAEAWSEYSRSPDGVRSWMRPVTFGGSYEGWQQVRRTRLDEVDV